MNNAMGIDLLIGSKYFAAKNVSFTSDCTDTNYIIN